MIRPGRLSDHGAILDLWAQLIANGQRADPRFAATPDARIHMDRWMRDSWYVQEPFPAVLVWDEGGIGGFIAGHVRVALPVVDLAPTARIGDLFVAPPCRRRGVGRRLVDTWVHNARSAGFPRIEVGTLTADDRARAFWRSVGFSPWQVTLSLN